MTPFSKTVEACLCRGHWVGSTEVKKIESINFDTRKTVYTLDGCGFYIEIPNENIAY